MAHDEIKKNCISGCAAEKKAETCGGKQNPKRKKTDVIDIAQQLKMRKNTNVFHACGVYYTHMHSDYRNVLNVRALPARNMDGAAGRNIHGACRHFSFEPAARHCNNGDTFRKHCAPG